MPCWFFEKKDLRNTASYQDGISPEVEARYRREGARFILDAGTKMGLRFDTCGTGVVYFHRFYMLHSFREFHRYVTGACCLFLAGKVEETPKKCKDIIKICQSLLTPQQFAVFGDDPKEEVMTLERILLQTIKFDLRLEHPYSFLLKFAKILKGDKAKIQSMVQMAWTFINDHLCTTLCLQWEAEIIAVSLMYLASRLSKFDIQEWDGKPPGSRLKWWEGFVEGITMELMEDICHQVLDLYSTSSQKREESPPMNAPRQNNSVSSSKSPQMSAIKRSKATPPSPSEPPAKQSRSLRNDASSSSSSSSEMPVNDDSSSSNNHNSNKRSSVQAQQQQLQQQQQQQQQQQPISCSTSKASPASSSTPSSGGGGYSKSVAPVSVQATAQPLAMQPQPSQQQHKPTTTAATIPQQVPGQNVGQPIGAITGQNMVSQASAGSLIAMNDNQNVTSDNYSQYNPYMTSQMYSSSFMSHEGAQSIQSLISQSRPSQVPDMQSGSVNPPNSQYPPPPPPAGTYQVPPFPPQPAAAFTPTTRPYPPPGTLPPPQNANLYQYPPPPAPPGAYPPPQGAATAVPPPTGGPPPPPPPPNLGGSYQAPNYPPPLQTSYQHSYPPPPTTPYTDSPAYKAMASGKPSTNMYQQPPPPHYPPPAGYSAPPPPGTTSPSRLPLPRNPLPPSQTKLNANTNPGLATVRITGRQNRR